MNDSPEGITKLCKMKGSLILLPELPDHSLGIGLVTSLECFWSNIKEHNCIDKNFLDRKQKAITIKEKIIH